MCIKERENYTPDLEKGLMKMFSNNNYLYLSFSRNFVIFCTIFITMTNLHVKRNVLVLFGHFYNKCSKLNIHVHYTYIKSYIHNMAGEIVRNFICLVCILHFSLPMYIIHVCTYVCTFYICLYFLHMFCMYVCTINMIMYVLGLG